MKGYSSGLQVESAEDVRIWLSICSEECAGFIRDVIGCVSQFDVLLKGVRCGDAQGLGNGDRLCEERYWVGDGHNLRRSDGDANLLVSYLDARGTKATWIAVKPTEPACLGHTSYIGHSRVEPNVRNSVCERGSRPERSLMTSKKVLIEECCRHLGCHMGIGIRNSCREAVLKLDVRQATH